MPTDNNAFFFKINQVKFANITNQDVMTCISLGKGINADKNIASEEELHVEFLKQLNKHHPLSNTILVAGLLKRWNFWELIREISDDELARRLDDIPKEINEKELAVLLAEKFTDIAISLEKKYIQTLENHLQENKDTLKDISFPFKILSWSQREKFPNFTKKSPDEKKIPENLESKKFIEATIKRFLQNKQTSLDIAKERLTEILPQLANLNFNELVKHACEAFIREEYEYFSSLRNTQLFYNGHIPALNPILKDNNNNLTWHTYHFKPTKNFQEELKTTLAESKPMENPLRLFSHNSSEAKDSTFIDTSALTPRSSKSFTTLFKQFLNNPSTATKELANRKIEEASRLLSMG